MALDRIPGELKLYIGGLFTLRRKEALKEAGITHVLSVLRLPLDERLFEGFDHMVVEVDDVDDENLLEHFPACNEFIQRGLEGGGGVFVHCVMGKSRSSTVMSAFLMQRHGITREEALSQIQQARPICEPNEGFWKQLELYHDMATPKNVDEHPAYQRWLYQREIELSRACGQAPEAEKIRFEDEHVHAQAAAEFEMRCRKCRYAAKSTYHSIPTYPTAPNLISHHRRQLATSQYLLPHTPRHQTPSAAIASPNPSPLTLCSHYFLDPLSWMKSELEQGKLEGRLECPKCRANVGKYAWQGMQCSCGEWVVPGISLAKGRVDEVKSRPTGAVAAGTGIRMPPNGDAGRRSGAGQGNL
ncbi:tyrosine protein phosphatase yvh1 [Friedmanniomyces endolithicus]|uniref:protein-tyrosine-phosphatase n=1 Tax=Friedmanniomyces endolithicus TaxID=329885 RepID=A0AAN6JBW0_9PEZI|nr:tyrosine protein phosphatase yvh1 [Friedmanniomyces endolithicus]KAK0298202.1 tyrosine protein phosphatase yvh1 [Friedmanniomyces endolithicus]KAK0323916.1 tyrosine protein phosphatase yvh1 [Friedmanniomyces endolithicus]KAK0926496.1 tyrosine protein phosphatase yvh1 [Friedmanniomyces endolithicus]KAK0934446.1 tyrosine protein phosphatase yvh1 [Friedmanniomyces endolithicus]